jgi:uncharacterized protein (TIGR03435 family)
MRRITPAALVLFTAATVLSGQAPAPVFEVVSVKRNALGAPLNGGPTALGLFRPNGLSYTNVTLPVLIRAAYGVREEWILGGPEWVRTARFDVIARTVAEPPRDEVRRMLQAVLEDRFRLVMTRQRRERDAYVLRLNRADGRLGPALRRSPDDCEAREKANPLNFMREMLKMRAPDGGPPSMLEACETMASIVFSFERALDATVIDETGLAGNWDWAIGYASLGTAAVSSSPAPTGDRPSIFVAAQEQLGLKLERRREPGLYEVLVIDSVEMPTPD